MWRWSSDHGARGEEEREERKEEVRGAEGKEKIGR
jgi:hypothetical protein